MRVADFGERVDFHERGIVGLEALPHIQQNARSLVNVRMVEPDVARHLSRGFEVESVQRVDVQALDRFGMGLCNFLDFGATVRCREHIEITRGAVH